MASSRIRSLAVNRKACHPNRRFAWWGAYAACGIALTVGFFDAKDFVSKEPESGIVLHLATLWVNTVCGGINFFTTPIGIVIAFALIWAFMDTKPPPDPPEGTSP